MKLTSAQRIPEHLSDQEILRRRAELLARPAAADELVTGLEVLHFQLAYEQYAIETRFIQEVIPLREITPLPQTPKFMLGLINLRGEVMSVLDIRKFFDLPGEPLSDLNRVMILRDGPMSFGVLVDRIRGIILLPEKSVIQDTASLGDISKEYLLGITADRLIVINAQALINDKKIILHYDS